MWTSPTGVGGVGNLGNRCASDGRDHEDLRAGSADLGQRDRRSIRRKVRPCQDVSGVRLGQFSFLSSIGADEKHLTGRAMQVFDGKPRTGRVPCWMCQLALRLEHDAAGPSSRIGPQGFVPVAGGGKTDHDASDHPNRAKDERPPEPFAPPAGECLHATSGEV